MANWEAKSRYLLSEIVKFSTYVESLENAGVRKEGVERERKEYEREIAEVRRRVGALEGDEVEGQGEGEADVGGNKVEGEDGGVGLGLGL